jgi:hypothetical protein
VQYQDGFDKPNARYILKIYQVITKLMANKHNNYSLSMDGKLFENIPKTVLAAIAVSFASRIEECSAERTSAFIQKEWEILHLNGIVPQKPPRI